MPYPNNHLKLKSLLKEETGIRWYPKPVEDFRVMLNIPANNQYNGYTISKNVAYNLQYLEYLQKQIDECCLSEIVIKMIRKNYIIIGMGIVEGLFAYLLKSTGKWNTSEWRLVQKNGIENAKVLTVNDKCLKVQSEVFVKVDSFEDEMNLDSIIKRVEGKHLLTFEDNDTFNVLSHLRKLRNRVHLHVSYTGKTEYYDFSDDDQKTMKKILFSILTRPQFCRDSSIVDDIYDFLK